MSCSEGHEGASQDARACERAYTASRGRARQRERESESERERELERQTEGGGRGAGREGERAAAAEEEVGSLPSGAAGRAWQQAEDALDSRERVRARKSERQGGIE